MTYMYKIYLKIVCESATQAKSTQLFYRHKNILVTKVADRCMRVVLLCSAVGHTAVFRQGKMTREHLARNHRGKGEELNYDINLYTT